jgi:hypothetical protein
VFVILTILMNTQIPGVQKRAENSWKEDTAKAVDVS